MVFFNYALRKLNAKIVYYGPGLCGKTTNLQWIHDHFEGGEKGKMVSLATEGDRTIFFDLLPLEIGKIRSMDVTLQLYTVPGQVHYNSTRQLVLRGADGVVFVADSQRTMQGSNVDSWRNLEENLSLQGIELKTFPHVLQFNKRDLGDLLEIDELDSNLNQYSAPFFEAVAVDGIGVQESLEGIVKLVMRSLKERYESRDMGAGATTHRTPGMPAAAGPWPSALPPTPPRAPQAPVPGLSQSESPREGALSQPSLSDPSEDTAVYAHAHPTDPPPRDFSGLNQAPDWDADEITGQISGPGVVETGDDGSEVELIGPAGELDPADDITAVDIPPFGQAAEALPDIGDAFEEIDTHTGILVPTGIYEDAVLNAEADIVDLEEVAVADEAEFVDPGPAFADEPAQAIAPPTGGGEPVFDSGDRESEEGFNTANIETGETDGGLRVVGAGGEIVGDGVREVPEPTFSEPDPAFGIQAPEAGRQPVTTGPSQDVEDLVSSVLEPARPRPASSDDDRVRMESNGQPVDDGPIRVGGEILPAEPAGEPATAEEPFAAAVDQDPFAVTQPQGTPVSASASVSREPIVFGDEDPFGDGGVPVAPTILESAPAISVSAYPEIRSGDSSGSNSLALKLTGTGAIVESGQVRALDVEVPVPGSWVGNQKVTLQLRLTLSPVAEVENE